MNSKKNVICILGMHRSGTSMLTRILNICGLYIGKEDELYPPGKGNELGHWESQDVLSINDKILARLGGNYMNPPSFPKGWENSKNLDDLRIKALKFKDKMDKRSNTWGFKEPRTCLTLPFWKKIIPNMRFIVLMRNSLEVADSLKERDKFPESSGKLLWSIYWKSIIKNTKGNERFITMHRNYFINWRKELKRVLEFLDCPSINYKGKESQIDDFIRPSMFHNKANHISALRLNQDKINSDDIILLESFIDDLTFNLHMVHDDYLNASKTTSKLKRFLVKKNNHFLKTTKDVNLLKKKIRLMKSSKFWKLREIYIKLKNSQFRNNLYQI